MESCEWKFDEEDYWETACGHYWCFLADGPKENGVKFCPYCGKEVVIK